MASMRSFEEVTDGDMKDFRRSVIRLFLGTFFLLFVAWAGLKAMQYHGDYERLLRDAQGFLRENAVIVFFQRKVIPFLQDKIIPALERAVDAAKGLFP